MASQAYQRVKTRKSKLASSVLEAVKKFFERSEFPNQPQKIRDYVRGALKPDGAAYYRFPTPQSCKVIRNHPDYIVSSHFTCYTYAQKNLMIYQPPDGFLQTEFIAPIAEQFLGYAKNSVLHPALSAKSPPKGLYGLILVAVRSHFLTFVTHADKCLYRLSGLLLRTCMAPTSNLRSSCTKNTGDHFKSSMVTLIV